jgi:cell wall-associated NlpC family hydrolase
LSTISTGITQVVGDRVEALGRGGAAIAVSSGLVASMALPAGAVTQQPLDRSPQSASIPLLGADLVSANLAGTSVLGSGGGLAKGAPLTAPETGTVVFDQGTLTATTRVAAKAARDAATAAAQRAAAVVRPKAVARTTAKATTAAAAAVAAPKAPKAPKATPAAPKAALAPTSAAATTATAAKPATVAAGARGSAVLAIAARYVGIRYRYGGTTPAGFDCSGYVQYVFRQVGIRLPRTAQQQLGATRAIPASEARPGDLVFMVSGGYASHVGIVAGKGMMYDSPRSGKAISKRAIYSSKVVYRRVTG